MERLWWILGIPTYSWHLWGGNRHTKTPPFPPTFLSIHLPAVFWSCNLPQRGVDNDKQNLGHCTTTIAGSAANLTARRIFCRMGTRSRSRTGAADVTTTNNAGDGGRNASPILLRLYPSSPPERVPRIRDGDAYSGLSSRLARVYRHRLAPPFP